jgi:hypothetical protein
MTQREFEVRWEGELPGTAQEVWDAITLHADGWLWKLEYEPRVGGAVRGLSRHGGTVTAWDPARHLATRTEGADGWFNNLDYILEPRGDGTYLRYMHTSALPEDDYDRELDACRRHTTFYNHSLSEYVLHFAGREAVYVSAEGPEVSAQGGFAALRRALGLQQDVAAGDRVRLTPAGLEPIEGVVDYETDAFLGVRSDEALYRFYGRDAWGYPVGVAHHLFGSGVDAAAQEKAWGDWLSGVFATEAVA